MGRPERPVKISSTISSAHMSALVSSTRESLEEVKIRVRPMQPTKMTRRVA